MGFLGRFFKASSAFKVRAKVGSLQGGLRYNLQNSGVDAPRSQEFMTRLTTEAWSIPLVSEFFQGLGFSFRDYDVMYRAAVRECPDVLIEGRNLVATFLLVDNCQQFQEGFQAFAQAVADTTGAPREDALSTLIASTVRDIVTAHPAVSWFSVNWRNPVFV